MEKTKITLPSADCLEKFRSEFLECLSEDKVERMIEWFVQHYQPLNIQASYKQPYWRARKCESSDGYESVREMLSPPPKITKSNRMNDSGSPLLYLSGTVETALTELNATEGEIIQVAGFIETLPPRLLMVGEILDFFRGVPRYTSKVEGNLRDFIHNIPEKARTSFIYMDALAAEIFRDAKAKDRGYLHSRSLARALLKRLPELDGIAYPSIALTDAANVAIKPDSAKSMYKIGHCSVVKISRRYTYGFYEMETIKDALGQDDDGMFHWK